VSQTIDQCTDDEWRAFWLLGQIKEIASPGFAHRVKIAREEGLLAPASNRRSNGYPPIP
jgi:hypothetical protein